MYSKRGSEKYFRFGDDMKTVVLVGNPNCGKTTLFNLLTHKNQKVGNWPGVTIERKSGTIQNTNIELVDLPGIYSLNSYSIEEQITQSYLLHEKPDVIVNVMDATTLERSLYLTTQLLDLNLPLCIVCNKMDELKKQKMEIQFDLLQKKLNVPIFPISANQKMGITNLIQWLNCHCFKSIKTQIFPKNIEQKITCMEQELPTTISFKRWMAIKILENDRTFLTPFHLKNTSTSMMNELENHYHMDAEQILITLRYQYIENIIKMTFKTKPKKTITDRLDAIFLHQWLGIPLFLMIMALIYFLSMGFIGSSISRVFVRFLQVCTFQIQNGMIKNNIEPWIIDLICDGILTGVWTVLKFIPQLLILFFCISFLESSGYMSRIAFLLDKIFTQFGLSGKSLVPFIIGTGCSVPGIMSCRIIKEDAERKMTILLTPFIPCSAKLPIISLFCSFFFPKNAWAVSFSFYVLAIFIILCSALLLKKIFFSKKGVTLFVQELPSYQWPNAKMILKDVGTRVFHFIKKTGSLIVACSIVVWVLLSFTWKLDYINQTFYTIEDSILASIGKMFSWFFYPIIGELNWAVTISSMQGFIAKEQVVSSMAIIQGVTSFSNAQAIFSPTGIFKNFTALSAYAFVTFNLFSIPCFSAISAMKQELGSKKRFFLALLYQMIVAWVLASSIYCIGTICKTLFF